jgi:hypothetical protein
MRSITHPLFHQQPWQNSRDANINLLMKTAGSGIGRFLVYSLVAQIM